jgi:hypothetical protein
MSKALCKWKLSWKLNSQRVGERWEREMEGEEKEQELNSSETSCDKI